MGGDRDGNPNVTPAVTAEALVLHRHLALDKFQESLRELARLSGGEVKLICSHDSSDIFSMKSAQREAQAAQQPTATPQPVSPPQPVQQRDLRARRNRPA